MTGKKGTTLHKSFQYLKVLKKKKKSSTPQQNSKNSGKRCFSLGINTTVLLKEKLLQAYLEGIG